MTNDYKPKTRQEIYDRIRATSKDEYILEEMIRLGFWPEKGELPHDPADELHRMGEIRAELTQLQQQISHRTDLEQFRKDLQEKKLRESKEKQRQTKEQRALRRKVKAEAWQQRKRRELLYLGEDLSLGISSLGLSDTKNREELLHRHELPIFQDAEDMARQIGITVNDLRFLAFHRKVSKIHHYTRFSMPKKSGGERIISAPMPRLKKVQHWILHHLLSKVPIHDAAHGFRVGRSIVTNATPHLRASIVLNLDLQDFFPSIDYHRVRGLFRALGYADAFSMVLALICTEADVDAFNLDGERYFIANGPRKLPQGAPTSPAITNILCSRLDRRLHVVAQRSGFVYTRYADDLTFSAQGFAPVDGAPLQAPSVGPLLRQLHFVIGAEGFRIHPQKTRILRKSRRQEVTGIVVNQQLSIHRETLRRFRALLFQIKKDGPEGKHWGNSTDVLAAAVGYAQFVAMVTPDKGRPLLAEARELQARWRLAPSTRVAAPEPPQEVSSSSEEVLEKPAKKKWWKLF